MPSPQTTLPQQALVIAATSADPAKPLKYFRGWTPERSQPVAVWTRDPAKAMTFDYADEVAVEAKLVAPTYPTRKVAPKWIRRPAAKAA